MHERRFGDVPLSRAGRETCLLRVAYGRHPLRARTAPPCRRINGLGNGSIGTKGVTLHAHTRAGSSNGCIIISAISGLVLVGLKAGSVENSISRFCGDGVRLMRIAMY